MTNGENRIAAHIREQLRSAHWLLEETVSDVSGEMAHFALPGKALPIGAAYAHYVTGEDWMVHVLFQGGVPLSAMGMGTQTVGFVLNNALLGHAYCHCGEISAAKGLQGKKGYPF